MEKRCSPGDSTHQLASGYTTCIFFHDMPTVDPCPSENAAWSNCIRARPAEISSTETRVCYKINKGLLCRRTSSSPALSGHRAHPSTPSPSCLAVAIRLAFPSRPCSASTGTRPRTWTTATAHTVPLPRARLATAPRKSVSPWMTSRSTRRATRLLQPSPLQSLPLPEVY